MARDLIARKQHHWSDLLAGKHKSKEMQEDYLVFAKKEIENAGNPLFSGKIANIDPIGIFEFNIILYCYPSQLTFYENLLITYLQPEYNTHKKKMPKLEKQFDENGDKLFNCGLTESEINDVLENESLLEVKDFNLDDCEEEMM